MSIGTLLLAGGGLVHPALLIQKSLLGTANRGLVLILRLNLGSRVLDLTGLVDVTVLDYLNRESVTDPNRRLKKLYRRIFIVIACNLAVRICYESYPLYIINCASSERRGRKDKKYAGQKRATDFLPRSLGGGRQMLITPVAATPELARTPVYCNNNIYYFWFFI